MKLLFNFFLLCVVAAWIPHVSRSDAKAGNEDAFPGWEAAPIPAGLMPHTPGAREQRFADGFPGKIGVFTDGDRIFVVRWVRLPTRKLHPAADCLRATGYATSPAPIFAEANKTRWGATFAQRRDETLRVRERIVDSTGRAWTDVSAWFWAAAFGRSRGPWWAVTVFEPAPEKS